MTSYVHVHGLENRCCYSLNFTTTTGLANRFPALAVKKASSWLLEEEAGYVPLCPFLFRMI